jgi:hypothetical protein
LKKITTIVVILASLTIAVNAQPFSNGGFDEDPQDVTIYGGISLLAIAGAAYGYKKLKAKK